MIGYRFRTILVMGVAWMSAVTGQRADAQPAHAQPVRADNQFSIEVFRPEFKSGSYSSLTSAVFIGIQEEVERSVTARLQVPFGYVRTEDGAGRGWEFRPANPSLGLTWSSSQRPVELGFSLQVPILPNDAKGRVMRIADISRLEAFVPDLWNFAVHSVVGSDFDAVQVESGLNFWMPLHNAVELVASYSLTARAPLAPFLGGFQIRGRAALSDERLLFGERTIHEAGAIVEIHLGSVRPGIVVRTPIQGAEIVDWVYGLTVTFY